MTTVLREGMLEDQLAEVRVPSLSLLSPSYRRASPPIPQARFTLLANYEEEDIRGLHKSDEFNLSFAKDAQGRIYYSVSLADSSHPGTNYLPLGATKLGPAELERVLVDVVHNYFGERSLSVKEICENNAELYRRLKAELVDAAK